MDTHKNTYIKKYAQKTLLKLFPYFPGRINILSIYWTTTIGNTVIGGL